MFAGSDRAAIQRCSDANSVGGHAGSGPPLQRGRATGHELLHGLAIVTAVMILAIGLLERYVRHQALKRRALTESENGG